MKQPAVYILASKPNGALYTGVTSHLIQRIWQHKNNLVDGYSKTHGTHLLVFYELHDEMLPAITREKQIKKWKRAWKIHLIEKANKNWMDSWDEISA